MSRIAIILARGGSKRLPRKNILDFHGKPMLAWSILAAIESQMYSRVLVSTDDEEIAAIARDYGAEVPFLRESAADDMATSSEATLAALTQAEAFWGERYGSVSQLMANCPLRNSNDIRVAVQSFDRRGVASQLSCFRYGWMNPWWALRLDTDGRAAPLFPDALQQRSQDLPELFCPSGAIWICRAEALKQHRTFQIEDRAYLPMHWIAAMDIDDEDDLAMAKSCYAMANSG